jgi:Ca2+-binding RTX toxin-like protein
MGAMMGGDDEIDGGMGDDKLAGDMGDDTLDGGEGMDTLVGGAGADKLMGGASTYDATPDDLTDDETLEHMDTAAYLMSPEAVTIDLSLDPDGRRPQLSGGDAEGDSHEGIEVWQGSDHGDTFKAAAEGSNFMGAKGNDTLTGGAAADTLSGGDGDDMFVSNGAGADTLMGDGGTDTVEYKTGDTGVTVNLGTAADVDVDDPVTNGPDSSFLFSIENVIGADGGDSLTGSDAANMLTGGEGDDALVGGKGNDVLDGGDDDDNLMGGEGADMLMGGDGVDTFDGGKGDDMIYTGKGDSTINGDAGDGADTIVLTGEAAAHTTTVNDFQVGSDRIDVSDLLDIDADDIDVAIANAGVTGNITDGYTYTIDLASYEGGSLVIEAGRSTNLSSDDFDFGS